MILPFTDEELHIIKSNYVLHSIPPRHITTVAPNLNDDHVNALMVGESRDIGFMFIADNFIDIDSVLAGLYNVTKYLKKKSILISWRYLYPQLKGTNFAKPERVMDYIIRGYKNIYIRHADIFPNNTYANQLMAYLISRAYDNEKRIILGIVPREGSAEASVYAIVGNDEYAKQIINTMYKVKL